MALFCLRSASLDGTIEQVFCLVLLALLDAATYDGPHGTREAASNIDSS